MWPKSRASALDFSWPCSDRVSRPAVRVAVQHSLVLPILACAQRTLTTTLNSGAGQHSLPCSCQSRHGIFRCRGHRSRCILNADIFEGRTRFTATVRVRLGVLRVFDSKDHISRRACDSVRYSASFHTFRLTCSFSILPFKCGIVLEKNRLMRCSGCQELLYCSKECQWMDWQQGHRDSCVVYLTRRASEFHFLLFVSQVPTLRPDFRLSYSSRECALMRTLIRDECQSSQELVHKAVVSAWAAHTHVTDPDTAFYTVYDHRFGGFRVSMEPITREPPPGEPNLGYWADLVVRMSRSSSLIGLHVLRARKGSAVRDWVFPFRRTIPAFNWHIR
jgi:hypothetical protein